MSRDQRLNINGLINPAEPAEPLFRTVTEHGRLYAYTRELVYPFPVDDLEEHVRDIIYNVIHDLAMKCLYKAELRQCPTGGSGRQVLDLGFGNGNWCYDMAEAHPDMHIHGIDLYASAPLHGRTMPNCTFHPGVDFTKDIWSPFQECTFDFIRAERLCGSVTDWRHLHWCINRYLKPGGLVEHIEIDWTPRLMGNYDKNPPVETRPLLEWWHHVKEGSAIRGLSMAYPEDMEQMLRDAGFRNFMHQVIEIPLIQYQEDRWQKHIAEGLLFALVCGASDEAPLSTLEGMSMSFLTRESRKSADEARRLCADVRNVLHRGGITNTLPICFNLHILSARKPMVPSRRHDSPRGAASSHL